MIKSCKTIQGKIKINFLYLILGFVILNFTNCAKDSTDYRDQYLGTWIISSSSNFTGTGPLSYDSFKSDIISYVGTENFLRYFPYNNSILILPHAQYFTFAKLENDTKGLVISSLFPVEKYTLYVNPDGTVDINKDAKIDFENYTTSYDSTVNKYTTKNYDLVMEEKIISFSYKFNSSSSLVRTSNRTLRLKSNTKNFNKTFPYITMATYTKK